MNDLIFKRVLFVLVLILIQIQQVNAQRGQSNNYKLQSLTMAGEAVAPADNTEPPNYHLQQGMIPDLENTKTQSGQYIHYPGMIFPEDGGTSLQYCTTNLYTTGCTSGDCIDDFILNEIENTTSGCSPSGYGDYTDLSTVLHPGDVYELTIKCGFNKQYVSIWVDMNNDFEFADNELLIANLFAQQSDSSYKSQITIPAEALLGEHRLRVRSRWNEPSNLPCTEFEFGETEDYTVNIESPGYCTEDLYTIGCSQGDYIDHFSLGDIFNTNSGCSPDSYGFFEEHSTDLYIGESYEVSLSCGYNNQKAVIWIDLNQDFQFSSDEKLLDDFDLPQSGQLYSTQLTIPTNASYGFYRMRVRTRFNDKPEDACAVYQYGEVEDYTIKLENEIAAYCTENLYTEGCAEGDGFEDFIFAGIENTNSGCSDNGYGDFTGLAATVNPGGEYDLTITTILPFQYITVWVDINQDFEFDETETILYNAYLANPGQQTLDVIIPEGFTEGEYRMRARTNFADDCTNACATYQFGEVEDYTLIVEPAIPVYCTENLYLFGCESGDGLNNFIFAGIENTGSGCSDNSYGDFTNMLATVNLGDNYQLAVSSQIENQYVTIWVDINEDFEFTEDEIILSNGYLALPGETYNFDIEIPEDFPEGEFRMRARTNYVDPCNDACVQYSFGEVEDYTIQINPYVPHYCTDDLYLFGCESGDGLNNFIFAGIENTNSGCSDNNYGDFTNMLASVNLGGEYQLTVSSQIEKQYVTIWVDVNQDFEFTEDEIILSNGYLALPDETYNFDVEIPVDFPEGEFRMRARTNYVDPCNDACVQYSFGEVEDYTIMINPYVPGYCTENLYLFGCESGDGLNNFIFAGIENTGSGCSENGYGDFTNLLATVNLGDNYQLAVSSQIENQFVTIWVDINEDFEFTEDEIILSNGYLALPDETYNFDVEIPLDFPEGEFRMRARTNYDDSCTSACTQYSFGEVEDYTIMINPYVPHYCTDELYLFGCESGDGLNNFIFAGIENTNSGCSTFAYGDFTNRIATVHPGFEYELSVSSQVENQYLTIWIDKDSDFEFEEDEIILNNGYMALPNENYYFNLQIPENLTIGEFRMRARTNYNDSCTDACEQYSFGEVEDYTIEINSPLYAYCTENLYTVGCVEGDGLNDFILAEIENTNSGCSENGYGDFTNLSATIIAGIQYPISFSSNYTNQYVSVWVDLNNDFIFSDAERLISYFQLEEQYILFTDTLTIPEETPTGTYRLRARANYVMTNNPCGTYSYGETEDYTLNIIHPIVETQSIYLSEGWNSLSSYLEPTENSMDDIFAELEDDLIIVQNTRGMYWPGQSINTFNNGWDSNSGYQVKMSNNTWINIHGTQIVPPQVELNEGWNMMPVFSPCLVDPEEFFAPSLENVFLVKDIAGTGVFWPEMNINTLENMEPGKSYLALLEQEATFTFSSCNKSTSVEIEVPDLPQFNGVAILTSPLTHTIAFAEDGDFNFNIDDEIGAFTTDGVCAGALHWTQDKQVITLFGDDPTTSQKEGFDEDEQIYFTRISAHSREINRVEFDFNASYPQYDGNFHKNGLSVISGMPSTGIRYARHPEILIYPNPAKDLVHINTSVDVEKIHLINFSGQVLMIQNTTGKQNHLRTSEFKPGIYFIKVFTNDNVITWKLVIE